MKVEIWSLFNSFNTTFSSFAIPLHSFAYCLLPLKPRGNVLDLSTVQAVNMLSVCWGVVERGVQMTSTMTWIASQDWAGLIEQSEDFSKAHVDSSWPGIFGYAGHCACLGSTCWALLCKCTPLCWATHGWPRNKENVEPCWAKSLTSFKFDSTRLNTAQHLSTGCLNALNLLSSTCWEFVQWANPVHLHVA